MAASLAQMTALGSDQGFIARVQAAILSYALTVEVEVGTTPSHVLRLALANKVVQAPASYAPGFSALLPCGTQATQVAIGTAYTSVSPSDSSKVADADILTLVALAWNIVAGA